MVMGLFACALGLGLILSFRLLLVPTSSERIYQMASFVYWLLALAMFTGLLLSYANHTLQGWNGLKKIELSPAYAVFPVMFALIGFFFSNRRKSFRKPNQHSELTAASGLGSS
jgi:TRAP-type C4-dicarboxylate transport system permease small subunit